MIPPLRIRIVFYAGYVGTVLCFMLWASGVEYLYLGNANLVAVATVLAADLWAKRWRRRERLALEVEEALDPSEPQEAWAAAVAASGTAFGAGARTTSGVALGARVTSHHGEFATVSRLPWYHRIWMLLSFPIRYLLTGNIRL